MILNKLNNFVKLILLLFCIVIYSQEIYAQKYSIDDGRLRKSGYIGLKYKLAQFKLDRDERKKSRKSKKGERIFMHEQKKKLKRLQTEETREYMAENARSSRRINKHKPQEYWHERIFNQTVNDMQITSIKIKLFFEGTYNEIKNLVHPENEYGIKKSERYFQQ